MAQYAGIDDFPVSFEEVNDGSARDAASVNVPLEALADRTIYLLNHKIGDTGDFTINGNVIFNGTVDIENDLTIGAGFNILYNPPTGHVTSLIQPGPPSINLNGETGWTYVAINGFDEVQVTAQVLTPHYARWWLNLPKCRITDVFATIDPASGHAALPTNMPVLLLFIYTLSTGVWTLFSATDTSGSVAAYQARHAFGISGINFDFDPAFHRAALRLNVESGPNALGNFIVGGVRTAIIKYEYD